jgi:hypothetical protein
LFVAAAVYVVLKQFATTALAVLSKPFLWFHSLSPASKPINVKGNTHIIKTLKLFIDGEAGALDLHTQALEKALENMEQRAMRADRATKEGRKLVEEMNQLRKQSKDLHEELRRMKNLSHDMMESFLGLLDTLQRYIKLARALNKNDRQQMQAHAAKVDQRCLSLLCMAEKYKMNVLRHKECVGTVGIDAALLQQELENVCEEMKFEVERPSSALNWCIGGVVGVAACMTGVVCAPAVAAAAVGVKLVGIATVGGAVALAKEKQDQVAREQAGIQQRQVGLFMDVVNNLHSDLVKYKGKVETIHDLEYAREAAMSMCNVHSTVTQITDPYMSRSALQKHSKVIATAITFLNEDNKLQRRLPTNQRF